MECASRMFFNVQYFLQMLLITCIQGENIHLNKISTLYIPFSYNEEGKPIFSLDGGSAEQMAYDFQDQIVYIVGASKINVVDISEVENPQILYHKVLGDFDPTDVEFCGDHVFVALDNNQDREAGRVIVFKKYNQKYNTMEAVLNITVGPLPDMLLPTSNCKHVLIALEAEAFPKNGKLVDPEGGVGLLKFHGVNITSSSYYYKRLNFHNFNDRWNDLSKSGVRFVYKEQNNTFSQDLEPEYITFSKDETKAYVCLQENNAIAVVDLETENITAIHGLGFKNWSNSKLDANDKDNEIIIRSLPVYGMYQPDAIHSVKMNDVEYIITANEGDSKDYSEYPQNMTGFSEEIRVKDISLANDSEVTGWASQNNVENVLSDAILGRLQITTENGRLPDGTFDKLYTFGGRGFSVWRADTMTNVYDSGSDVEDTHAESRPDLFNANPKADTIIKSTMDSRSDNKGPESESLAVAYEGNKVIVFLGNERPGSISIYSFTGNMTSPRFESAFWDIPSSDESWTEAFDRKTISSIDPEDLKYIPPHQSPSGRPLLLVAGSVSGTLSILEVKGFNIENTSNGGSQNYLQMNFGVLLPLLGVCILEIII
ncbi:mesenchyme-specific cell surface glycoprotein-like [Saccostrea cucullata]|uniref:mesenchyme-specific cell surface glycoprotein-like n=1 Tax=Saccostrea cuccullata TaxID=36930 RepID=UPI002ED69036